MCEADDRVALRGRQGVKRGCLHLDGGDPRSTTVRNHRLRLTKWRIGGPACADGERHLLLIPAAPQLVAQQGCEVAIARGREVVIAGSLVAQGALNQQEVRWRTERGDLS